MTIRISSEEIRQDVKIITSLISKDSRLNKLMCDLYIRHDIKEDDMKLIKLILQSVYRKGIAKAVNRMPE